MITIDRNNHLVKYQFYINKRVFMRLSDIDRQKKPHGTGARSGHTKMLKNVGYFYLVRCQVIVYRHT